jgi:aryl-alcohol dehydrogenase-like predicted oxidoreductase
MVMLKEWSEYYQMDVVHWSPQGRGGSTGKHAFKGKSRTKSSMEHQGLNEQITVKLNMLKP